MPVRTSLIHRITRGPIPWWHTATICDFAGGMDDAQLAQVQGLFPRLTSTGFDAVCIRPEHVDSAWGPTSPLPHFIEAAHECGLKVIVRLAGESIQRIDARFFDRPEASEALMHRVSSALAAGADGIDIGSVAPRSTDGSVASQAVASARLRAGVSRLSRMIQAEMAMSDSQPILTASVSGHNREAVRHHVAEDWFHHLRDGALRWASWDARQIMGAVAESLEDHDHVGAISPWYWWRPRPQSIPASSSVDSSSDQAAQPWAESADTARHDAMALFGLSLPGAAYVAFGSLPSVQMDEGGATPAEQMMSQALHIRRERGIGSGSLGVLSGLAWAGDSVSVHVVGGVTVVLNTADAPVAVPADQRPLLSSQPTLLGADGATVVPPSTCAWFVSAPVRQEQASYWD